MSTRPMLTIRQCADRLTKKQQAIRRLISSGHLRGSKVGGEWRVDPDALEEFLQRGQPAPATRPIADADEQFSPEDRQRFL